MFVDVLSIGITIIWKVKLISKRDNKRETKSVKTQCLFFYLKFKLNFG